jgi:pimeloyl-ACP methyl ester carboxylesterase
MFITFLAGIVAFYVSVAVADPLSDRITVTVRGQGPDVVLIPGLASSSAVWDATAAHLEGRYRLHIVQVAGFAPARLRARTRKGWSSSRRWMPSTLISKQTS